MYVRIQFRVNNAHAIYTNYTLFSRTQYTPSLSIPLKSPCTVTRVKTDSSSQIMLFLRTQYTPEFGPFFPSYPVQLNVLDLILHRHNPIHL